MEFYSEPRLAMSYGGRLMVRFLAYGCVTLLVAVGFVLAFSEIHALRATGFLIIIFFIDFLLHSNRSERSLINISPKYLNIAVYLSPKTYRALEFALDRTALESTDFTLNFFEELLKQSAAKKVIVGLNIKSYEFIAKLEARRRRSTNDDSKEETIAKINQLVLAGFSEAKQAGAEMVEPFHLFQALLKSGDSEVAKMFEIFGHKPEDVIS